MIMRPSGRILPNLSTYGGGGKSPIWLELKSFLMVNITFSTFSSEPAIGYWKVKVKADNLELSWNDLF
jgi:hypothetical protein